MKTAQALDGQDRTLLEEPACFPQRLGDITEDAGSGEQLQLRAAIPTGIWLGMEATIGGIVVFGPAGGAHLEFVHRSARAIIRDVANDGEARATVGAVDERIAESTVARIGHFAKAVVTHGDVRGNQGTCSLAQ